MIKQTAKIAALILLIFGSMINAAAQHQQELPPSVSNCYAIPENISFAGIETANGTFEQATNTFYGNNFVLESVANNFAEGETHYLNISLDFSCTPDNPCEGNSHFPVIGGAWSLIVLRNNIYAGTIYGKVSGGTIDEVWNRNGQPGFRQTRIKLQASGGIGSFARRSTADISGVYEAVTDVVSKQTSANISFTGGLNR